MENTRQRYPGCKLPQPYPAVSHPKQDARAARKLMPLLLGRTGALSRYIALSYAAAALGQTVPMLAQTLECLAQTEQMHMSLLLDNWMPPHVTPSFPPPRSQRLPPFPIPSNKSKPCVHLPLQPENNTKKRRLNMPLHLPQFPSCFPVWRKMSSIMRHCCTTCQNVWADFI